MTVILLSKVLKFNSRHTRDTGATRVAAPVAQTVRGKQLSFHFWEKHVWFIRIENDEYF